MIGKNAVLCRTLKLGKAPVLLKDFRDFVTQHFVISVLSSDYE
jgi:hypothetical protein